MAIFCHFINFINFVYSLIKPTNYLEGYKLIIAIAIDIIVIIVIIVAKVSKNLVYHCKVMDSYLSNSSNFVICLP